MKKFLLILGLLLSLCIIPGCTNRGILDGLKITEVNVKGNSQISVGEEIILQATINPEGEYKNEFIWSTSNEEILKVDENGKVLGVSKGVASIKAVVKDNEKLSGKIYIRVFEKQVEHTKETPKEIKLTGESNCFVGCVGYYRFDTVPENASQEVIFESSNPEVIEINNMGVAKYLKETGDTPCIITCKSKNDETISASILVNVTENSRENNLEVQVKEVIKNSKDSILAVMNYQKNENGKMVAASFGSGFVYRAIGILENGTYTTNLEDENINRYKYHFITNRHVVENSDSIKIYIHMIEEEVEAELVHYDDKVDLAVVTFEYNEYIKPLPLGNSDIVEQGDFVIAIGNPKDYSLSSSATLGIVSYPIRYIPEDTDNDSVNDWDAAYIQHDASINPGSSGGPLLNMYGEVIAINTMKFASVDIDNMGFSVPTNTIVELLPYLEKVKTPQRAKLGVTVIEISNLLKTDYENAEYKYKIDKELDLKYGLYITAVEEASVSFGRLLPDDILVEFNGVTLKTSLMLRGELNKIVVGSGDKIICKVYRNSKLVEVEITF